MSDPPPLPKSSRRNRIVIIIIGVALAPIFGLVAWHLIWRLSNHIEVGRLEARAKRKGEPLTLIALAQKYPIIPDEENAAVPLLKLWVEEQPEFWKAFQRGERRLPERHWPRFDPELPFLGSNAQRLPRAAVLTAASRVAIEGYVKTHAEHLERVRMALRRPRCAFPVRITDGYGALLPYLPEMKSEAQGFWMESVLEIDHGEIGRAMSALNDVARIGQALREEPLLIGQLVRVGCLTMVLDGAQRLLSQNRLSAAQLNQLQGLFEGIEMKGALRTSLVAERAVALSVFSVGANVLAHLDNSSADDSDGADTGGYRAMMWVLAACGLRTADRRLILETMEEAIDLAGADSAPALERYEDLFAGIQNRATNFPPKIFSAMLLPALSKAGIKFATFEGRRRAGLTSIAVERFRVSHGGSLPEKLEELVPRFISELPKDPFDGELLRFRRLSAGFVIYSVGKDRKDDGGKERPPKGSANAYDEIFAVER